MFNEPLGLPRGSVRAILAILAILGLVLSVLFTTEINSVLAGLCGVIVTFYFTERQKESVLPPSEPIEKTISVSLDDSATPEEESSQVVVSGKELQ